MKKKIKGFSCLSLIGITVVGLFVAGILVTVLIEVFSSTKNYGSSTSIAEESKNIVVDSIQLKEEQRIKDSLDIVIKERREEAENNLKKFRSKEDEFRGVTFYTDRQAPNYINHNFIYPYIAKKDDSYSMRLKFQYTADDWLFIKKGIFLIDGETYNVTGRWERDNSTTIWEWLDINVSESEHAILHKLVNSKTAKIRYEGSQYRKDRNITSKEKGIIKRTLEIYDNIE